MTSPYQQRLQAAWVAFVTEFADGQVHSGHSVYGLEGFCALIVHRSDGPPLIVNEVDLVVETDERDFPTRICFAGGGEEWEWNVYPGGARMPIRGDVGGDHRWTQGVVRRVGELRDIVSAEALMETYQDRLRDVIIG